MNKSEENRRKYAAASHEATMIRFWHKGMCFLSADLKAFYGFVNGKLFSRKSIPPLIQNNVRYEDPEEQEQELFQEQFISVFTDDDGLLPDFPLRTNSVLDDIDLTEARVLNALKNYRIKHHVDRMGFLHCF